MKGLLIKDFRLMKVQKNFFILIIAVGIGLALFSESPSTAIVFPTLIIALFSFSSIGYDEFDNGNAFLFSLPITRKDYVMEKYCFGLILGLCNWALFSILIFFSEGVKKENGYMELIMTSLWVLPFLFIMLSIMLPAILKFGSEKGRIVVIVVFALAAFLGIAIKNISENLGLNLIESLNHMPAVSLEMGIIILLIFSIILMMVSIGVSLAVVRDKEF